MYNAFSNYWKFPRRITLESRFIPISTICCLWARRAVACFLMSEIVLRPTPNCWAIAASEAPSARPSNTFNLSSTVKKTRFRFAGGAAIVYFACTSTSNYRKWSFPFVSLHLLLCLARVDGRARGPCFICSLILVALGAGRLARLSPVLHLFTYNCAWRESTGALERRASFVYCMHWTWTRVWCTTCTHVRLCCTVSAYCEAACASKPRSG